MTSTASSMLSPSTAVAVLAPLTPAGQQSAKTTTVALSTMSSANNSASLTQSFDPTQSLSALLASLSLPPLPASFLPSATATATSSLTTSAPSIFSGYLLSILHSTLSDLHSVLTLTPRSLDDPQLTANPALLVALKDHFQLEHHHGLLANALAQLSEADDGYAHQKQLLDDQFQLLMDSTRALIRLLPPQASVAGPPSPTAGGSAVSASLSAFHALFSHLVALITARLQLSAKDAAKQQTLLTALTAQQSSDATLIASLTAQLQSARQRQSATLSQQSALLSKYQSALSSLLDTAEEDVLNFNRRMKAEEEESERLYEAKEAELVDEERRLQQEADDGLKDEWRAEAAVRRKVGLKEAEVAGLVQRYDDEMQWQEDVYNDLSHVYERERQEARRLTAYFHRLGQRRDRERLERERLRAQRDEELRRAREREESARVLERLFDSWMGKHGPKEKKKAVDKKKKYKTMWRPPRDGQDGALPSEQDEAGELQR